ncbi:MAG: kelch motif-containing protein [Thermoplasmata archaeon]|nr:kelch motif-containing protein [Thermoplasmata archaeon]
MGMLLLLGVAALLLLPPLAEHARAGLQPPARTLPTPAPRSLPAQGLSPSPSASEQFAKAAASLGTGAGPAGGVPVGCRVNPDGVSGSCGAPVASAGQPGRSPYSSITPGPTAQRATPGALFGASMAYDAAGSVNAVILFGGARTSGYLSSQTWSFVDGVWYNDTPYYPGPEARWGAAMTYDAADGYLLLMGGCISPPTAGFCPLSASETWSLSATGWSPVDVPSWRACAGGSSPGPGPLYDVALSYDAADGYVVLFGGAYGFVVRLPPCAGGGPPPPPPPVPTITVQGNTWAFSGGSWLNISSSTGSQPSPRYGAQEAYDPIAGVVILFGGTNRTEMSTYPATSDTWEFVGGNWKQLSSQGPPDGRRGGQLVYDPLQTELLLIGGALSEGVPGSDIYAFSSVRQGWRLIRPDTPPVPTAPDARYSAMATFDGFDQYLLLYGGQTASGSAFGDLWKEKTGNWTELSAGPSFPAVPQARWEAASAFLGGSLPGSGSGLLFGGQQCLAARCLPLGDTWQFSRGVWSPVTVTHAPSARYGAAMAAYPAGGYIVLFGGCGILCPLGDTWKFSNGQWTQLHLYPSPSARYFASLSLDAADGFLILFGGCLGGHQLCPASDTWVFDVGRWINATGGFPGPTPAARFGAGYDSSSGYAVLYGGMGVAGPLNDTWWFENLTAGWVQLPAGSNVQPIPSVFPTFAYDPLDQLFLLWSGCNGVFCPTGVPFEYPFNGTFPNINAPPQPGHPPPGWSLWFPTGFWFPPPPTYGGTPFWDPNDGPEGYLLIVGGRAVSGASTNYSEQFVGGAWNDLTPWT